MERDYKLFIKDIVESISLVENYILNVTEENFYKDSKLQDAVIRRLEIIGEAASRIPRAVKQKNPQINWNSIVEYRNFIVHSYFDASMRRIWQVAKLELNELKVNLSRLSLL